MILYHVTPYSPFQIVDLEQFGNPYCDFGLKMYFHFTFADANDFLRYIGSGRIAEIDVPNDMISWQQRYNFQGYSAARVGFSGLNEDGQYEDMNRQEKIDFTRLIIANRHRNLDIVPDVDADIMIGSRADARVVDIIDDNILTIDDYWNDNLIIDIFNEIQTFNLGPQIALSQDVCDQFISNKMRWL